MQNLLQFIRANFHIFLFLFLQSIALFALIRFNRYHQSVFFSTSSTLNGSILNQRKAFINYFSLQSENRKLKEENILLRTRGAENYIFVNRDTFEALDSSKVVQYSYMPAKVIYNSIRKKKNFFTLDRGEIHGVQRGMGVISPLGVAGKIVDVSEHFSVAMSILNTDFVLTPKINGETHYGKVRWDGKRPSHVVINRISDQYDLEIGQEVTTTEYGHYFPQNIKIGNISNLTKSPNEKFWDIEVELSTNISQLGEVYIVRNTFHNELENLESAYINGN